MLVFKSIKFNNIGRYTKEQTIHFDSSSTITQIIGNSGTGKSTILKAIEFLLGLNDISANVLQSRLTKEQIYVIGNFELDGQLLIIERSKKLLIELNGEIVTGSSKITEEKLDSILGMPRDLFRKILHKRQNEGGFFLQFTPSEVHKFLTSCLGLDKEQGKIIILDGKLKNLESTKNLLLSKIEGSKKGIEASQDVVSILGQPPINEFSGQDIKILEDFYNKNSSDLELKKKQFKNELLELENQRPIIASTPFDRSQIDQLQSEIDDLKSKISYFDTLELKRQSLTKERLSETQSSIKKIEQDELNRQQEVKNKIKKEEFEKFKSERIAKDGIKAREEALSLSKELAKIRSSICPTCNQSWVNDSVKLKESEIIQKINVFKEQVISGLSHEKNVNGIEENIKALSEQLQTLENIEKLKLIEKCKTFTKELIPQINPEVLETKLKIDFKNQELVKAREDEKNYQFRENEKKQLLIANYNLKQNELRDKWDSSIKDLEENVRNSYLKFQNAQSKLNSFTESFDRYNRSLDALTHQLLTYYDSLNEDNKKLELINEEIELAEEAKKVIKSYLSASFEDALSSIGDTATRFIRNLSNMSTATITFEGTKETAKGILKEEVSCIISMDGELGIPIKSLSGGERSSTDLSVDLAVIEFIQNTTGKGCNLFLLDEPFSGLNKEIIIEALEMLKEFNVDKNLFIIDHNPEAAQFIENRLEVARDGLLSNILG